VQIGREFDRVDLREFIAQGKNRVAVKGAGFNEDNQTVAAGVIPKNCILQKIRGRHRPPSGCPFFQSDATGDGEAPVSSPVPQRVE
jgi:hypothetical protein